MSPEVPTVSSVTTSATSRPATTSTGSPSNLSAVSRPTTIRGGSIRGGEMGPVTPRQSRPPSELDRVQFDADLERPDRLRAAPLNEIDLWSPVVKHRSGKSELRLESTASDTPAASASYSVGE